LAAKGRKKALRLFSGDDPLEHRHGQGLDVDRISDVKVRHDRGRVGVHEDATDALFAHGFAGLRARVVELRRLPDDDRA
jgi:hypothetical protein